MLRANLELQTKPRKRKVFHQHLFVRFIFGFSSSDPNPKMIPVQKTASGSEMEQADALAKGLWPNMGLTDNLPGLNMVNS